MFAVIISHSAIAKHDKLTTNTMRKFSTVSKYTTHISISTSVYSRRLSIVRFHPCSLTVTGSTTPMNTHVDTVISEERCTWMNKIRKQGKLTGIHLARHWLWNFGKTLIQNQPERSHAGVWCERWSFTNKWSNQQWQYYGTEINFIAWLITVPIQRLGWYKTRKYNWITELTRVKQSAALESTGLTVGYLI